MELLEPLKDELQKNYRIAQSTHELITNERDMLQGETDERISLFELSTDVWHSVINAGHLNEFDEAANKVAEAYRQINTINQVITKFNRFGNRVMYTPLLRSSADTYDREELIDIIADMASEVTVVIMDAQDALDTLIQTECPVCGRRFASRTAMKSHVTQKDDPEHEAIQDRVV